MQGSAVLSVIQAVGSSLPIVKNCILVASQAIEAADLVVANHARCERLALRIGNMLPVLRSLQRRLEK